MNDPQVQVKSRRVLEYCRLASNWCIANGYKPWKYLLIPHDRITSTTKFETYSDHF